ncbi:MAG: Ig-like domain-containing protein [Burkholderiales bacterium]|nr:Ig-like domain-containing protein [Burkholderiales bacterium]
MGQVGTSGLEVDDSHDLLRAKAAGPALVIVTRTDTDGRLIKAVASINTQAAPVADTVAPDALVVQPDVYPGTLTLVPGGSRQLKVHLLDPNTGEQTDISQPTQTVFAGIPETTEQVIDPSTIEYEVDPTTGEYLLDPDTGELIEVPGSGQLIDIVYPAVAPVISGTRYFTSDESIATVSDTGGITALREGQVTISVVHFANSVDAYGNIIEEAIGQSDIALNVEIAQVTENDPTTGAPAGIAIAADHGGAVQAATGETVLIGAGALQQDTAVGINRIDITDIATQVGLPLPGAGRLATLGAFHLDIGTAKPSSWCNWPFRCKTKSPRQLATKSCSSVAARYSMLTVSRKPLGGWSTMALSVLTPRGISSLAPPARPMVG